MPEIQYGVGMKLEYTKGIVVKFTPQTKIVGTVTINGKPLYYNGKQLVAGDLIEGKVIIPHEPKPAD